jgi:hypothetical protein
MIPAAEIESFEAFQNVLNEKQKDVYAGSPFRCVKELSSSKKGKFFERITEEYLRNLGFVVSRAGSSDYDRLINNIVKLEIKGSSLWEGGIQFRWSQIRPKQSYDIICFLAMFPDKIEFFGAPKAVVDGVVLERDNEGNWLHNMHGGKTVNSGTFLLQGFPDNFTWFQPLDQVINNFLAQN